MRELVGVYYPQKLASRRDEVLAFATELIAERKVKAEKMVKVFENKRHDFMAVVARKER